MRSSGPPARLPAHVLSRPCAHVRSHRRTYFEESLSKAKAREAEEAERRRRARDKLASYMRHCRPAVRDDRVWEEWLKEHEREPEVKAVGPDWGPGGTRLGGRVCVWNKLKL